MNYRLILRLLGKIMLIEAASMALSLGVSLLYHDGVWQSFALTIAMLIIAGCALNLLFRKGERVMRPRDGFITVAMAWLTLSAFGALPLFFSGIAPNYIDALFEIISGFSGSGSTIIENIEEIARSIVFWRSFTNWIGGMGVLLLALAVIPASEKGVYNLMRAESPGPSSSDRIVPKLRQTAAILYRIYLVMTLLLFLMLILGKMSVFDAIVHSFSTAGTGGFSSRLLSIGAYNNIYVEVVLSVFMLLFSVNFSVWFALTTRKLTQIFKNTELRIFLGIVVVATVLIIVDLMTSGVYSSVSEALRHASFQVSTIISTTGYSTADYNLWPGFSKFILVLLMFIGGCASSTAGGIKVTRIVMLLKSSAREFMNINHPHSVNVVRMDGRAVPEDTVTAVMHYFIIYILMLLFGTLIVSFDELSFETSFSAVLAALSNIGPGLGAVGPMANFNCFSHFSKAVLSLYMLIGRLEIFPILILFVPGTWKKH